MRRSAGLLGVAAVVAAASGCGGAGRAPHFEAGRGWHVLVEPGQIVSAANVPFAAADRSQSAPARTVAGLPPDGIAIWVEWLRRGKYRAADRSYPERPLPLRVEETGPAAAKGFTCPRAAQAGCARRLTASASGWDITLWVFFGHGKPSAAQLRAADTELSRFRT